MLRLVDVDVYWHGINIKSNAKRKRGIQGSPVPAFSHSPNHWFLNMKRAKNVIPRYLENRKLSEYLCYLYLLSSMLNIFFQWNVRRASTWRGRMVKHLFSSPFFPSDQWVMVDRSITITQISQITTVYNCIRIYKIFLCIILASNCH